MRTYGAMLRLLLAICFLLPATAASALAKIPAGAKVAVMPIGAYGDATVYNAGAMATEYVMAALKKESSYELYDCDPEIVADRLAEIRVQAQQRCPRHKPRPAHRFCFLDQSQAQVPQFLHLLHREAVLLFVPEQTMS